MTARRTKWLAAMAAAVLAATAACSSSGDGGDTGSADGGSASQQTSSSADAGSSSGDASSSDAGSSSSPGQSASSAGSGTSGDAGASDKSIRFQLYQQPTTFDPIIATQGADGQIVSLQFRALVNLIDGQYQGDLAESIDTSPDATEFTFHLRTVNWSDGEPLTAEDVVFSFEAFLNADSKSAFAKRLAEVEGSAEYTDGSADHISGVSTPDEHTVVVKIGEPNVAFLANLGNIKILPKHVLGDIPFGEWAENDFFHEPTVGSGPYLFSRWVDDDQIEFKANPEFWVKPKLGTVYAQYLTTDVARAQLETGEINIAQLTATDVADVKKLPNVDVVSSVGNIVMVLVPAVDKPPLDNVKVRQAIMYAMDREAIVQNVLAGQGKVVDTPIYTPDWAQNPDLEPYTYDPEKAKQLLAEVNWDSSTVVNLGIVPGQQDRESVLAIVAGELQAVGINAKVKTYQPADLSKAVTTGNFDTIISILGAAGEPSSIRQGFSCANVRPAGSNFTAWCNKKFDELMTEGVTSSDPAERAPIFKQIQTILHDELPVLPLYAANAVYGVSKGVTGVNPAALTTAAENWDFAG